MARKQVAPKKGELPEQVLGAAVLLVALREAIKSSPGAAPAGEAVVVALPTDPPPEPAGGVARLRWRLDRAQRSHPALGFPIAVMKKFGEDKAGHLAALVAYFGFFSLFPLMVAFTSVLGYVVTDADEQIRFAEAAADQIPVVGETIRNNAGRLQGSLVAITVGVVVALWAGLRIVDAMQNALNDVWEQPASSRPNLVRRRLRGLLMLGLIGGGLLGSIAASNVATLVDVIPGAGKVAIWAGSAAVSIGMYLLAFQLLTEARVPWRHLWPGALFAGTSWWALQTFGSVFVVRQQEAAGKTYGQYASIIALMAFLFLAAQLSIVGAEIAAVKAHRLWPRSLVKGHFTEADIEVFTRLAGATRQNLSYDVVLRATPAEARAEAEAAARAAAGRRPDDAEPPEV